MATIPGVDLFGVPSPAALVSDCQARGWKAVGGYAYDDDVLSGNPWGAGHVQALANAGIQFLPIITLRTGTTVLASALVADLQALGVSGGPVGWDREDTTALPSEAVMAVLVAGVRAAGYGPMVGYRWPYGNLESWYAQLMDSLWAAIPGGSPVPPAGWQSVQYGQAAGPSGATYDLDTFDEAIWQPAPSPVQELEPMNPIRVQRPDGNADIYTLISNGSGQGTIAHLVEKPDSTPVSYDLLPGAWLALLECGYYGNQAYARGVGTDQLVYQATWTLGSSKQWGLGKIL